MHLDPAAPQRLPRRVQKEVVATAGCTSSPNAIAGWERPRVTDKHAAMVINDSGGMFLCNENLTGEGRRN